MILYDPMIFEDPRKNEVWKPLFVNGEYVKGYIISNFGKVYDLEKDSYCSTFISNSGYEMIRLVVNGESKLLLIHRLVAENFIFHTNLKQNQVNHKDGAKLHNEELNLEWMTPKENTNHAFETGLANSNIGENSHLSKLTNDQVEKICVLLSEGKRYRDILLELGLEVTPNNMDMIGNIYRGIAWRSISSKYSFPDYDDRFRVHDKETIKEICKYIEEGFSNIEICNKVFNIPSTSNSRSCKHEYELVRMIRNKKYFVDISKDYNF